MANRFYAQGARCGHIEGKGRAGSYTLYEEHELSFEAAANQGLSYLDAQDWASGYRAGYVLAASGEPLPAEFADALLHETEG